MGKTSMPLLIKKFQSFNPAWLAFCASLLLSITALSFEVTIGTDAATYLDAARIFHEQGARAAFAYFDWAWFSVLIGWLHGLTGWSLEFIAYFFCVLLLAGACALMVDMIVRRVPGSAGWALLVVLAIPALNSQRGEIMREPGFWFFSFLALWLALHWQEKRGGWAWVLGMNAAVVLAVLFRLEAVILLPALMLWQALHLKSPAGWQRLCQISLLPIAGALLGFISIVTLAPVLLPRIGYYWSALNPHSLLAGFFAYSQQFAEHTLEQFSDRGAGRLAARDSSQILFAGLLFVLIWKFVKLLGVFGIPFLFRQGWAPLHRYWVQFQPLALTFGLYFLAMVLAFLKRLTVYGRYLSLLDLLLVPLLVMALMALAKRFPRAIKLLVAAGLVSLVANVVSTSGAAKKTHYIEAGRWLAEQTEHAQARHYFDDGRIAWYAGWGYQPTNRQMSREDAMSDARIGSFRYYVVEARPDAPWLLDWLARHEPWRVLAQFANRKGATIVVLGTCADTPDAPVCRQP